MKNLELTYPEIVSSIALIASLISLGWNIVRDIIKDKNSITFSIVFGELGNIRDSTTSLFMAAGDMVDHKFDNPKMLISIINTGRRKIVLNGINGEYKNEYKEHKFFSMAVAGLPKMIESYEVFSQTSDIKGDFFDQILSDNLKKIWVDDTKGKKWLLKKDARKRLRNTAQYIKDEKHLS